MGTKSSRNNDIGTLIGLIIFIIAFLWVFRQQVYTIIVSTLKAALINFISFLVAIGEFLIIVILPLGLGYLFAKWLMENNHLTSGWGLVICVIFLILFSYTSLGLVGIFIGLIAWGMIGAFGIDKVNDSGMI